MAVINNFGDFYAPVQDYIYEVVIGVLNFGGPNRSVTVVDGVTTYTDTQRNPNISIEMFEGMVDGETYTAESMDFFENGILKYTLTGLTLNTSDLDAAANGLFNIGWAPTVVFGDEFFDGLIQDALGLISGLGRNEVIGSADKDQLRSMGDYSVVRGAGGADFVIAGEGKHRYDGGGKNDTITFYELFDLSADVNLETGDINLIDVLNDEIVFRQTIKSIEKVTGSFYDDSFVGDAKRNVFDGKEGDDVAELGEGNDKAKGDLGDDTLNGGDGDDKLEGGKGRDIIDGGDGNDKIKGGRSGDLITGGDGDDEIDGGSGNDDLRGGWGKDKIKAGAGKDYIVPGRENDDIDVSDGVGNYEEDRIEIRPALDSGVNERDIIKGFDNADRIILVNIPETYVEVDADYSEDFDEYVITIRIQKPGEAFGDLHTIEIRAESGESLGFGGGQTGEDFFIDQYIQFATDDPA